MNLRLSLKGDFNSVKYKQKKNGPGSYHRNNEVKLFDRFICDYKVVNLVLIRRLKINWLDMILISEGWCLSWPKVFLWTIDIPIRSLFDDFIEEHMVDCWPKPFKMLKCCWINALIPNPFVYYGWANALIPHPFKY